MMNIANTNQTIVAMYTDHGCPTTTSTKYRHVNTYEVVQKFEQHGWMVAKYNQSGTVKYQGYQTHVVQLRSDNDALKLGDSELRIVIMNDHRGSKSLILKLGVFRLVCSNGMVVSDAEFESVRLRHVGSSLDEKVNKFIERIAIAAQHLKVQIAAYSARPMDLMSREKLAMDMLKVRYGNTKPIDSEMVRVVLQARRYEDIGNDIWATFNRIQENIIRGVGSIRRIRSVKRDVDLNVKMWDVLKAA